MTTIDTLLFVIPRLLLTAAAFYAAYRIATYMED